ncbi:MAG TPA: type VI secretion system tube protein Hcp [Myxococcota bacterium]|nr:type VI secretion system tube protein Hcp [Myxococcota bacterium]
MDLRQLRLALLGLVLPLVFAVAGDARATSVSPYIKLEGVPGEKNPPGVNGAIEASSVTIAHGSIGITKRVDSTSSQLASDETAAHLFGNSALYFYNDPNIAPAPDASIPIHDALISSIQTRIEGSTTVEDVSLTYASPTVSVFLALPGISGPAAAPGYTGLIDVQSITMTADGFSALKLVDSTSSALSLAEASAHLFASASLLFYTNIAGETQPDFSIDYHQLLISSIETSSQGDTTLENVTFTAANGSTVGHPAPEPALLSSLLVLAVLPLLRRRP